MSAARSAQKPFSFTEKWQKRQIREEKGKKDIGQKKKGVKNDERKTKNGITSKQMKKMLFEQFRKSMYEV